MRHFRKLALLGATLLHGAADVPRVDLPDVVANPNVARAGVLHDGVLTIALEAKLSSWHADGDKLPGIPQATFAEEGKAPVNPGPLVRAPQGTDIRFSIRNSLAKPITFFMPTAIRGVGGGGAAGDTVVVAPGEVGTLVTRAVTPGNYAYRAMTPGTPRQFYLTELLTGGVVIDATADARHDRVFVMTEAFVQSPRSRADPKLPIEGRVAYMMNGVSWPNTERIPATTGDSLHWRVINASSEIHPMHLHGFYFRVDDFSPPTADRAIRGAPGRMEVTERMPQMSGMSISWSPERAGNWIFHCHFARHIAAEVMPDMPDDHAMSGMGGLVIGIDVAPRAGDKPVVAIAPKRHLRLVAIADEGYKTDEPSWRFVLEENGRRVEEKLAFSPTIDLVRGEPVSITVVNHLREATAVHWHGIELESYNDGVAGWSGSGAMRAPLIAPRDSRYASRRRGRERSCITRT